MAQSRKGPVQIWCRSCRLRLLLWWGIMDSNFVPEDRVSTALLIKRVATKLRGNQALDMRFTLAAASTRRGCEPRAAEARVEMRAS